MKATKKVEFDKTEIEIATKDALIKLAAQTIGEPQEDEEYTVELCAWRHDATVEIVKKQKSEGQAEGPIDEPIAAS